MVRSLPIADSRAELVRRLSKKKDQIEKEFKEQSLKEIVTLAVGNNTFRAFHNSPTPPSKLFRKWAVLRLGDQKTIDALARMRSQSDYDKWLEQLSASLRNYWYTENKKELKVQRSLHGESKKDKKKLDLDYGPSRKLTDLLMKGFARWNYNGLSEAQRKNLIKYLHVALDSRALRKLKECDEPVGKEIRANARMGDVTEENYDLFQSAIRRITYEAKVPAIYFDMLVWNMEQ